MFMGYIAGYTITDEINYCPGCGEKYQYIMQMERQLVRSVVIILELCRLTMMMNEIGDCMGGG